MQAAGFGRAVRVATEMASVCLHMPVKGRVVCSVQLPSWVLGKLLPKRVINTSPQSVLMITWPTSTCAQHTRANGKRESRQS